eukprot:5443072-Pleurochrysis_carterae.AAC.2
MSEWPDFDVPHIHEPAKSHWWHGPTPGLDDLVRSGRQVKRLSVRAVMTSLADKTAREGRGARGDRESSAVQEDALGPPPAQNKAANFTYQIY